jgi:hypothetical protein
MYQPPETQTGHWLQQHSISPAHLFLPFKDNIKLPALLINDPSSEDPFVFIIPFINPDNWVTLVETAVRECYLTVIIYCQMIQHHRLP